MIIGTLPCSLGRKLVAAVVLATAIFAFGQTITPQLKASAQGGDVQAQMTQANAYLKGNGIKKNEDEAFKWFLAAAEQGNVKAQVQVASMYRNGVGVSRDKAASVPWYAKAAWAGDAGARYNLAVAYYNGDGIEINDQLAYAWFVLAAVAGDKQAEEAVARTESEQTKVWVERAKFNVAHMVEKGLGVKPDPAWAASRYRELADKANTNFDIKTRAQVSLALMLAEGRGMARDTAEAQRTCEAAAKAGSSAGYACLGYFNFSGLQGAPDFKAAFHSYQKAAQLGDASSKYMLGKLYESGKGVKQDLVEALAWYWSAAVNGEARGKEEAARLSAALTPEQRKKAADRKIPLK